jgi:methylmalonyl-CoA mutase
MSQANSENAPGDEPRLLADFPLPSLDQWQQEVERLLKGASFAKRMFTNTVEGIRINPLYSQADTSTLPWLDSRPGQAPFVRGTKSAGYLGAPWLVAQELPLPDCVALNKALLEDLPRGQTAISLALDVAGRQGLDPDQAASGDVGRDGTSLASLADMEKLLTGIGTARLPLMIQAGPAALPMSALLLAYWNKQDIRLDALHGCIGFDPAAELARTGSLPHSLTGTYRELGTLTRWAIHNTPGLKTLPVDEAPWHEGGADSALSLGLILAAAVQQMRGLEPEGIELEDAAARIQFNVSVGSDFFMEIAKIRALRLLWHNVLDAAGCGELAGSVTIHARTSRRSGSVFDAHVNLLRVTTQAMSAVLAGVDSLHVGTFDEVDSLPDEFSRRIARNLHAVLARECRFDQVSDPAGGSHYVESLTAELAEDAWKKFQEVEQAGGLIAVLESGWVQEQVAAAAELRATKFAIRDLVMVGTNQYANTAEADRPGRPVDLVALHTARAEEIRAGRPAAASEHYRALWKQVAEAWKSDPGQALPMLAEAAVHGATLGELFAALNEGDDRGPSVTAIVGRRDAEPFEALRGRVRRLSDAEPKNGRVFFACLGDYARYMPRLDFTRRFFAVAGFEVSAEQFFSDGPSAAAAAEQSGAATVVLVGLDGTYGETALPAVAALKALKEPPRVMLAGRPADPPDLTENLKQGGVVEFLHARSNVLGVLGSLIEDLESGAAIGEVQS